MTTIGNMTIEELKALIDQRIHERLESLFGEFEIAEDEFFAKRRILVHSTRCLSQLIGTCGLLLPVQNLRWTYCAKTEKVMTTYVVDASVVIE